MRARNNFPPPKKKKKIAKSAEFVQSTPVHVTIKLCNSRVAYGVVREFAGGNIFRTIVFKIEQRRSPPPSAGFETQNVDDLLYLFTVIL